MVLNRPYFAATERKEADYLHVYEKESPIGRLI